MNLVVDIPRLRKSKTIFLWKSCELFVDDADEKKREEEEKEEEGEEDNKKKLRIHVDAGLEITPITWYFSSPTKVPVPTNGKRKDKFKSREWIKNSLVKRLE